MEFDGVSWRVIGTPDYKIVRSVAIDQTGTVYIGGKGDIGYLAPDPKGSLQYVSLLEQLDGGQKNFFYVWRTHATKEGIYFASSEFLFRWNPENKRMKAWQSGQRFLYSFIARSKLYIHQLKSGLRLMNGDSLEILPGTEAFADDKERIYMIVPYDPNAPYNMDTDAPMLLIGTQLKGFYLYDSNEKTARPFPTGVDDYLKKNTVNHGIRLSSGDFALATRLGGVVIMDPRGHLKYIFDKTYGLQDDNIKYVSEDSQGNLWLCLEKGLSKIEYASPLSVYDERSDLSGMVITERNLRFEFAAPFFEAETVTQYQCFLEGYDHGWSTWNNEPKKNYTNLDPGQYSSRVQARNVYEYQGSEDTFRFIILFPWYRKWWAYVLYGAVGLLPVFLFVRWRASKLEHEKQKLEQLIRERTKEINEKNLILKEQSEKLAEMDHVKSLFFANISHEFRTPLTLIMSPLEQMLSESRGEKQKQKLEMMLRNSQQLLTLINQLLDLSRFDSGKMKLQAACQNIVPFLEGILASFHILAQQNNLVLEFHSKEKDISLYFDTQKMEEVMYNLLINAVKFTPGGGKIVVALSKEGEDPSAFVKISVQDTGIGFSEEQLPNIFDRFYQAERPDRKGSWGTGIGLALAREIIQLHYGKIDVHSREEQGTEFIIRLPMGNKHLKPNEIVTASETPSVHKKSQEVEKLFMLPDEEVETDAVEIIETSMPQNTILVVDDNATFRKYIRGRLEPLHKVVEAVDGQDGINKAKETIPDLIISDIMMPGIDGYELCNVLKKDITTSHIPIILLTAKAAEEDIIEGLETGADDYITKPFNTKILFARIKNLIERRRQLQLERQKLKLAPPAEMPSSSIDEAFLKKFREIIERNLSKPDFNEDQLCLELQMSQDILLKKLQALTGETPNQFILSYRLERAAQLLKNNFGNVTEVAFEVGFSNTADFSRCFKEKFQQLPTSFQIFHQSSVGTTGK